MVVLEPFKPGLYVPACGLPGRRLGVCECECDPCALVIGMLPHRHDYTILPFELICPFGHREQLARARLFLRGPLGDESLFKERCSPEFGYFGDRMLTI